MRGPQNRKITSIMENQKEKQEENEVEAEFVTGR